MTSVRGESETTSGAPAKSDDAAAETTQTSQINKNPKDASGGNNPGF
jgi:hypothetical protein